MTALREKHETELRAHIDKVAAGIEAKDIEALRRLYTPDVVSFDVEPPLRHVGIAAKLNNWRNVFTFFEEVTYEVREPAFTVSDEVAYGHFFGRLSGTLRNGTATSGMWVRATVCFRRIDGEWLIAHDQVSVPFDISTGMGVADLTP
ncbi:DUF4440 domain-containing protein [Spongiactinospora rosea]|uniref:DUF4440 domain-containing protein n=1 Tax=Spongiactinospora rosea TaxID=2248750 RepID=A0A366M8B8_9ACTN|nr:nuclear transport factor 2 family protein [Spongiactinospora rosea]RBQ21844.1 DUF4440 domain-containing protein [Spongiactinospora rosea]